MRPDVGHPANVSRGRMYLVFHTLNSNRALAVDNVHVRLQVVAYRTCATIIVSWNLRVRSKNLNAPGTICQPRRPRYLKPMLLRSHAYSLWLTPGFLYTATSLSKSILVCDETFLGCFSVFLRKVQQRSLGADYLKQFGLMVDLQSKRLHIHIWHFDRFLPKNTQHTFANCCIILINSVLLSIHLNACLELMELTLFLGSYLRASALLNLE